MAQIKAGNDLLMPGNAGQTQALLAALNNGTLTRQQLDTGQPEYRVKRR